MQDKLLQRPFMPDNKVWFITGCSTGFGRELAKLVLDRGYRAVVTARNPAKVEDIAKGREDRALVLQLDVTDPVEVDAAVKSAVKRFGRIDVLVNNAGIGYFGAVEESDEEEVRRMFEINFWGLSRMGLAAGCRGFGRFRCFTSQVRGRCGPCRRSNPTCSWRWSGSVSA